MVAECQVESVTYQVYQNRKEIFSVGLGTNVLCAELLSRPLSLEMEHLLCRMVQDVAQSYWTELEQWSIRKSGIWLTNFDRMEAKS